jgi:hypothetical protein
VAHETGHLVHFEWRKKAGLVNQEGAWWQLYTEGFAQRCEQLILGRSSWHMRRSAPDKGWLEWCQDNQGWLASEFLHRVNQDEDMRPFFGSWFELRGYKQTGYYLGHEVIKNLQEQMDLHKVSLLTNIEGHLRPILMEMAN